MGFLFKHGACMGTEPTIWNYYYHWSRIVVIIPCNLFDIVWSPIWRFLRYHGTWSGPILWGLLIHNQVCEDKCQVFAFFAIQGCAMACHQMILSVWFSLKVWYYVGGGWKEHSSVQCEWKHWQHPVIAIKCVAFLGCVDGVFCGLVFLEVWQEIFAWKIYTFIFMW